jgi:hypothetical protein
LKILTKSELKVIEKFGCTFSIVGKPFASRINEGNLNFLKHKVKKKLKFE